MSLLHQRSLCESAMSERERMGLPVRVFLYTLDQISMMLEITEQSLKTEYLHYEVRSPGARPHNKMQAQNVAPDGDKPDWRVAEQEFIRWLRYKGFRIYQRGTVIR